MKLTHLVVRRHGLLRVLNVVCRREDILGLLNRIFNLARDKQRGQGRVLVVVLGIAKIEAKLVEIRARRIKGPYRPIVSLPGLASQLQNRQAEKRRSYAQIQVLPHSVYELNALQAVIIFSRGIAAVFLEHAPYLELGGVLVRAGDVAGVRPNARG